MTPLAQALTVAERRARRWLGFTRPRLSALCRTPDGRWQLALSQTGVRMENRSNIVIGPDTLLLRGATVLANGGRVTIGKQAMIAQWAVVQSAGGSVTIGDRSSVGDGSNLYGQGDLIVGNDVLMASGVRIMTAEHRFDRRDLPIKDQPESVAQTVIGDGAWLAANVIVLAGVTVGEGAVCGAGAVVTKDIAPYTVVAGVPARPLRTR